MCGYFCMGLIDFILKGKSLSEYINLFFHKDCENKYKIILKQFQWNLSKLKHKVMFVIN